VPKLVLTVNHASGAGYYAMAGQGFDPDFILSWPTGRMAVMEGEAAVMAVHGTAMQTTQQEQRPLDAATKASVDAMRLDYEAQLDARYAAARGFVDAIIAPEETRDTLAFLLRVTSHYAGPHLGPFVLDGLRG
jgi:acetyl-CoA carboxylase carboxyltransferase component